MKKKALLSSILVIALCFSVIVGSTLALFTSVEEVNIAVTSGQVKITANVVDGSLKTWSSLYHTEEDARFDGLFDNNGTAEFDTNQSLLVQRMTPGDVVKFTVHVENESNVNIRYRIRMISEAVDANTKNLTDALVTTAYINGNIYPVTGSENATAWTYIDINDADTAIKDFDIKVHFPNTDNRISEDNNDNQYQNAAAKMTFIIEAVQGNANPEAGHTDFVYLPEGNADAIFYDNNGYAAEGIYNGEGNTVEVTSATIGLAGTVTYSDVTIDASNLNSLGRTFWDVDDGIDSTLILGDNTTLVAMDSDWAVHSSMKYGSDETFTIMMDESSKIVVNNGIAISAQGWGTHTANVVLNGSVDELFELNNGSVAMFFEGNDGEYLTVNIFVNSVDDIAEYKAAMINPANGKFMASGAKIAWIVNGTQVGETESYAHDDTLFD